jgi:hypothetical protein
MPTPTSTAAAARGGASAQCLKSSSGKLKICYRGTRHGVLINNSSIVWQIIVGAGCHTCEGSRLAKAVHLAEAFSPGVIDDSLAPGTCACLCRVVGTEISTPGGVDCTA